MTSPYYEPSGRLPAATFPLLVLSAIAIVPGAWAYGWLTGNILFLVSMFATCAFALYLGMVAKCCARWAKVRNPVWMGRFGTLIGAVGWYCQWAAFFSVAANDFSSGSALGAFAYMLAAPGDIVRLVMSLAEADAYEIFGITLAPAALYTAWAAELAMLLVLPHVFGQQAAAQPFNESTNSWMKEIALPQKFECILDPKAVVELLETQPSQLYSTLVPNSEESPRYYATASIYRNPGKGEPFVSITNIEVVGKGEKSEENGTLVVQFLKLPGMDADDVIQNLNAQVSGTSDPAHSSPPSPPELAEAIASLESGRFDSAYAAAVPFVEAEEESLRVDANRVCALATSHLDRWSESKGYWKAVFADEPTAYNALQIATSSVMTQEAADGEQWLLKARELNAASEEIPGITIATNYISALDRSGQPAAALPYLEEIKQVYEQVSITDPTHLFLRRLPTFDAFLNNSFQILGAVMDAEQCHAWYSSMLPHLDERGKRELNDWLGSQFATAAG